jgi:hypothetical protein
MRQRMYGKKDKQVFKSTAKKTKAVNVSSAIERGGIRL